MVKVSVLMLSWNTSFYTIPCLESFKEQTFKDFKIVLVDNGSEEKDFEKLKEYVKNVKGIKIVLKRLEKNVGITGGMNYGYKFVEGDYVIFMNNDMLVDKNFLKELVSSFENNKNIGAVLPKMYSLKDGKKIKKPQLVGGKLSFYGTLINKEAEREGINYYNKWAEFNCATGGCVMVSTKVMKELGEVYPSSYFLYFEDIDLTWRIKSKGYKIFYNPNSVVYHKGSGTIGFNKAVYTQQRFIVRNKYLTFWRNLPILEFFLISPFLLTFDVLRILKQLTRGNIQFVKSSTQGFLEFLSYASKVKTPRLGSLNDLSWSFEKISSFTRNWNRR